MDIVPMRPEHADQLLAIYLAQVGEFSFVLGRDALSLGILTADAWQMLLPASIVTMLVAPTLTAIAPRFADRIVPGRHRAVARV